MKCSCNSSYTRTATVADFAPAPPVLTRSCPLASTTCLWSSTVAFFSVVLREWKSRKRENRSALTVINVWCVAVYVSNHKSSVRSALPGSDRRAWAHGALQCLRVYKADFRYSHSRGDAPQWHEASRLNRSAALPPPPLLSCSLSESLSASHSASLHLHSLCFIVTRHSKSWLEYQSDNFLTVSLYLSAIALIRWFLLSGFVLSWQRWPGWVSSSSRSHFVFPSVAVLLYWKAPCTHTHTRKKEKRERKLQGIRWLWEDATQRRNVSSRAHTEEVLRNNGVWMIGYICGAVVLYQIINKRKKILLSAIL